MGSRQLVHVPTVPHTHRLSASATTVASRLRCDRGCGYALHASTIRWGLLRGWRCRLLRPLLPTSSAGSGGHFSETTKVQSAAGVSVNCVKARLLLCLLNKRDLALNDRVPCSTKGFDGVDQGLSTKVWERLRRIGAVRQRSFVSHISQTLRVMVCSSRFQQVVAAGFVDHQTTCTPTLSPRPPPPARGHPYHILQHTVGLLLPAESMTPTRVVKKGARAAARPLQGALLVMLVSASVLMSTSPALASPDGLRHSGPAAVERDLAKAKTKTSTHTSTRTATSARTATATPTAAGVSCPAGK